MSEAASEPNKPVETKKGKGKLVGIMVALALILGAGAAGAVLAPKYLGGDKAAADHKPAEASEEEAESASEKGGDHEAEEEEEEPEKKPKAGDVHEVQNLEAIVVDSRAADGSIRHIKVGLTIELPETVKEAEFKSYVPRAREAAIGYFRTRDFEQLSDPKNFAQVVKDLNKEIIGAVGKKRAKRIVITDFVAQ
ncbi:MAG: flagellar basal body-associated FliL family protein [Myxococcales bacterium]|nr:MAG: flagellar basal body-associated FliL family protein [Myxococcales bacterium]